MTHSFRAAVAALRLDPGQLPIRDRAVLRILNRARLANAEQLGILVYRNRHYAQIRLRRLWDLGYLERTGLPPPTGRGGSPYVYRLSPAAIARLGYAPRLWRGPGYIAHTLDAVEAVCALVRPSDPEIQPDRAALAARVDRRSTSCQRAPPPTPSSSSRPTTARPPCASRSTRATSTSRRSATSSAPTALPSMGVRAGTSCSSCRPPTAPPGFGVPLAASATGPRGSRPSTSSAGAASGLASPMSRGRQPCRWCWAHSRTGPSPLAGPAVGSRRWLELLGSGGAEAAG